MADNTSYYNFPVGNFITTSPEAAQVTWEDASKKISAFVIELDTENDDRLEVEIDEIEFFGLDTTKVFPFLQIFLCFLLFSRNCFLRRLFQMNFLLHRKLRQTESQGRFLLAPLFCNSLLTSTVRHGYGIHYQPPLRKTKLLSNLDNSLAHWCLQNIYKSDLYTPIF